MRIFVLILKKARRYFLFAAALAVIVPVGAELFLNAAAFVSDRAYLDSLRQRLSSSSDIRVLIVSADSGGSLRAGLVRDEIAGRVMDKNVQVTDVFLSGSSAPDVCAQFLKSQIAVYSPDIVVLCRGIYDSLPSAQESGLRFFLERFRLGRLFVATFGDRFLPYKEIPQGQTVCDEQALENIKKQLRLELGIKSGADFKYVAPQPEYSKNLESYEQAATVTSELLSSGSEDGVQDRIRVLSDFIKQNPDAFDVYQELVLLYFEQERHRELVETVKSLFERAPVFVADGACADLVQTSMNILGLHEESMEFQRELVSFCTDSCRALEIYNRIGFSMVEHRGFDEVERFYKELVIRFADNPDSFLHLGQIYLNHKRFDDAQKWAGLAFEVFPSMSKAYYDYACMLLFTSFLSTGKMTFRGEDWFWNTVRTRQVERGKYFSGMAVHLLGQGREQEARRWFKRARNESKLRFNLKAEDKYRKMAKVCLENNLGLCFMQYPLRKTVSFRKIVADAAGRIVFVDNFGVFYDTVKTRGFDYCFIDRIGADCGTLTQEASLLAARNLAQHIVGLMEKD